MRIFLILSLLLTLSACDSLAGRPGSWSHNLFASDEEAARARDDKAATAKIICQSQGYTGQGLYACIQNSL